MELLKNILSKISKEEAYMYFYRTLSRYVNVPIIDMDIKYIQNIFEQNISRVLYQLELNGIKYIDDDNNPNNKDDNEFKKNYEYKKILPLIKGNIEAFKTGNKMSYDDVVSKNSEEIRVMEKENNRTLKYNNNYYYNSDYMKETILNKIMSYKNHSLIQPLEKYIQREFAKK